MYLFCHTINLFVEVVQNTCTLSIIIVVATCIIRNGFGTSYATVVYIIGENCLVKISNCIILIEHVTQLRLKMCLTVSNTCTDDTDD